MKYTFPLGADTSTTSDEDRPITRTMTHLLVIFSVLAIVCATCSAIGAGFYSDANATAEAKEASFGVAVGFGVVTILLAISLGVTLWFAFRSPQRSIDK
tara:strand:- start:174 stop:470 length:297 start_codon:yes stop_codon:yes gene_type:complete